MDKRDELHSKIMAKQYEMKEQQEEFEKENKKYVKLCIEQFETCNHIKVISRMEYEM